MLDLAPQSRPIHAEDSGGLSTLSTSLADQAQIQGIRQATLSKIENGQGGMLNTFISYAASLGLEVTLTPAPATETPRPPSRESVPATPRRHRLEPAG